MGEIFKRTVPDTALDWTGERLTTGTSGQVEIEHLHRYFLARCLCRGLDVLDVASGEGYGSALLAQSARSVTGVELSEEAVAHATTAYQSTNLRFQLGDARNLPLSDASIDAIVSFETLEHFFEHNFFIAEARRVLRPNGLLIISSPDRDVYSPAGSSANEYHMHELSRGEFEELLRAAFRNVHVLVQRPMIGSVLIADGEPGRSHTLTFEKRGSDHYEASRGVPRSPYIIAVASDAMLPDIPNSIFIETDEVGGILSRAFGAGDAIRAQVARAEQAEATIVALRAEQEAIRRDAEATVAALRAEQEAIRRDAEERCCHLELAAAELSAIRLQRDALRSAFRRQGAKQAAEALEWRRRYLYQRDRVKKGIARLTPPGPVRRFIRKRLLGTEKYS